MKKTVLVTGGTTGIGKATVCAFGAKGYRVAFTSRNPERGKAFERELQTQGIEAAYFELDVTDEEDVVRVVGTVAARFGKLDVWVNNAGISGQQGVLLGDSSAADFKAVLDTNVLGVFYGMKYAIRSMLATGGGTIVNVASVAGLNGIPTGSHYCASKHAVVGLTKSAAAEYADQGIRINAVAPGGTKTEMVQQLIDSGRYSEASLGAIHPMKQLGGPEGIANAIVFLASDECPFMTGSILCVDGGYCAV